MPPELLGFSREPRNDTCLGDMWCLGELAYQALTGRATFETFADLGKYCAGLINFPDQILRDTGVSEGAIRFIVAVMGVKPSERLSAQSARRHSWMEIGPESQPGEGLNESLGQSEWSLDVPFTPQTGEVPTASAEWTATVTNPCVTSTLAPAAETSSTHKPAQMSTSSIVLPEWLIDLSDLGSTTIELPPFPAYAEEKRTGNVATGLVSQFGNGLCYAMSISASAFGTNL